MRSQRPTITFCWLPPESDFDRQLRIVGTKADLEADRAGLSASARGDRGEAKLRPIALGLMKMFSRMVRPLASEFLDAVAGDESDPRLHRRGGAAERRYGAVEQDCPRMRERAEQRPADAFLSGAAQADEADDLGLRDGEIDRAGAGDRQARHGEPGLLRARARRGLELVERLADDQRNQFLRGGVGDQPFADQRPVAQHGDAIGDLEHFVETMRDIDHADAARLQRPQGVEQPVHLVGGQRGRRLVEHQHVGLHAERARDRDERLLGAA